MTTPPVMTFPDASRHTSPQTEPSPPLARGLSLSAMTTFVLRDFRILVPGTSDIVHGILYVSDFVFGVPTYVRKCKDRCDMGINAKTLLTLTDKVVRAFIYDDYYTSTSVLDFNSEDMAFSEPLFNIIEACGFLFDCRLSTAAHKYASCVKLARVPVRSHDDEARIAKCLRNIRPDSLPCLQTVVARGSFMSSGMI